MLHDDDAVALVAQFLQRSDQLAVVPLMQADGRLVQDIEDIDQLRADLRRKADPLPFTTRQRSCRPVQRQIVQTHVQHEVHPVRQFFQDIPGDGLLTHAEDLRQMRQPVPKDADLHRRNFGDGLPVDAETLRILVETRPVAHGTFDLLVNIIYDTGETHHLRQIAFADAEQVVRTVDQQRQSLVRDVGDRLIDRESVLAGDGAHDLELAGLAQLTQRHDTAVGDAQGPVRHDAVDVHVDDAAEALAVRAVAFRRIEGEGMGRRLLQRYAALRIHQVLGEMMEFAVLIVQHGQRALALVERGDDRVANAFLVPVSGLEFVDHKLDEMGLVAVHGLKGTQVLDLPVDAHLGIATLAELFEQLAVMAFAAAHQRAEQQAFASLEPGLDQGDDLLVGVTDHLFAADRRIGTRGTGIKQPQEIIDFSDGSDRRARVGTGGLLLDSNDGTQALDAFHLGLLQDTHEVLGIGGQGVHVAALPFGIKGIEGQRGLAAAAESGHDDELPAGNVHVDIFQVVRPRTPDLDVVFICFRLYVLLCGHRDTKIANLCRYPCFSLNFAAGS